MANALRHLFGCPAQILRKTSALVVRRAFRSRQQSRNAWACMSFRATSNRCSYTAGSSTSECTLTLWTSDGYSALARAAGHTHLMQCVVAFDCLVAGMCWWPRQSQLCSSGGRVIYDALCSLTIRLRCGERKDDETHTHHSRPHIVRLDRFDRKRTKRTNAVMLSREPPMDAHQTCIHIRD